MKARPLLLASCLACLALSPARSALGQATPPSPLRRPAPAPVPEDKPVAADPAGNPLIIAGDEKADPNETPVQRARRQVVVLLRAGKPLGVGSVLAGDGRILTALSPLGHGNNVDARFSDGKLTRVRVVHSDRAWDLALVATAVPRADVGLRASRANPTAKDAKLTSFAPGAKDVTNVSARVKEARTLVGGDNAQLEGALVLDSKHKAAELGSPVIDERGDVVAILAQACAPVADKPCNMALYAAPVAAVKGFLRGVTAAPAPPAVPFGIQGVAHDAGAVKGVRVLSVQPRSPAAGSGLRSGADTIVAVNGAPVTTPEALASALRDRAGRRVELLVFGAGRYREIELGPPPVRGRGFRRVDPLKRMPWRRPRPRPDDAGF